YLQKWEVLAFCLLCLGQRNINILHRCIPVAIKKSILFNRLFRHSALFQGNCEVFSEGEWVKLDCLCILPVYAHLVRCHGRQLITYCNTMSEERMFIFYTDATLIQAKK